MTDITGPESAADILARLGLPAHISPTTPIDAETAETPADAAARRTARTRRIRDNLARHIPAAYADARMADLDLDVRGQLFDWLAGPQPTVVITGGVGVGKTHAAYALAVEATARGVRAAAWPVPRLLAALAPDGTPETLGVALTVPLAVFDDLGTEKPSEWRVEQITAIFDARIAGRLRQIVTTNADYNTLADRYGERAMSRLTGGAALVRLAGKDRRRVTW